MTMAHCISTIRIKRNDQYFDIPCGKCGFCLQNKRKEWSFRLQKEYRYHESSRFLTLTYDNENLPLAQIGNKLFGVLRKKDFQDFMKRLRKAQHSVKGAPKIKYYAVGEYGSKTSRPHFHAIVFGLHPKLYDKIEKIWDKGNTDVGDVNNDSIDYITKYVINRHEELEHNYPPFALISKGIGLKHLEENYDNYRTESTVRSARGYPQVMPKYYRDKLEQNKVTNDLRISRYREFIERKESEELDRLSRLHPSPEKYEEERKVAANDRVAKSAKKGGKF